ncbi:MAG: hypothetical protein GY806_04205 [Gammaproteobacteria bacterium]|nr:hypothetical protein [Gammaproteobacteria bacterium]
MKNLATSAFKLALIVSVVTFYGCGGGGGDGDDKPRGVFIDSAVSGLTAVSGDQVTTTNANGEFTYIKGTFVDFRLGFNGPFIGLASAQPIMSPLQLANTSNINDEEVTNIARFLQTIDADMNPENGITIDSSVIDAAVGISINFNQGVTQFETSEQANIDALTASLPGGARALVAVDDARAHLQRSISTVVTGRYDGSYGGDGKGTFSVFVDRSGALFGWATDTVDGHITLNGSASVVDGFVAGNASTGTTFSGTIDGSGKLSGTWTLLPDESGTFSGNRSTAVASGIDHDLIAMFAGSWAGTLSSNQGARSYTAELDANGNISRPFPDAQISAAITNTGTNSVSFSGLQDDGSEFGGTLTLPDQLSAEFSNIVTGESGTYTATMQ